MNRLISVAISLLDRQMQAQAKAFEQDGGFTNDFTEHAANGENLEDSASSFHNAGLTFGVSVHNIAE